MSFTAVFGVIFIDIKGFPAMGRKYIPNERNLGDICLVDGGVARNIAENLAHVNREVEFVTIAEDGGVSAGALEKLRKTGVCLDYVTTVREGAHGMWLVILNENGDVAGQISKMPDIAALERLVDEKGDEIISRCENIVLEMDAGEAISEKVFSLAQKYGKKVYVIVGNMSVILKRRDLVKKAEVFICNDAEIANLLERDISYLSPDRMKEELKSAVTNEGYPSLVVTMGENGCAYYDKSSAECGVCPAERAKVVDTSGAGDAFFSGTVAALTNGLPLCEAVRHGTHLACLTLQSTESSCPEIDFLTNSEI